MTMLGKLLKRMGPAKVNQAIGAVGYTLASVGAFMVDVQANPNTVKVVLGVGALLVGFAQKGYGMQLIEVVDALDGDTAPPPAPEAKRQSVAPPQG
jgi:hypothetical protein